MSFTENYFKIEFSSLFRGGKIRISTASGLDSGFFGVALSAKEEGIFAGVSAEGDEANHAAC